MIMVIFQKPPDNGLIFRQRTQQRVGTGGDLGGTRWIGRSRVPTSPAR